MTETAASHVADTPPASANSSSNEPAVPGRDAPVDDGPVPSARRQVIAIAIAAFVVLGVGLFVGSTRNADPPSAWVELVEPVAMPDVTLTDTDGDPYDLRDESAGRLTLRFGSDVEVRTRVARLGNSSLQLAQEVWQDGRMTARGLATLVNFDPQTRRATAIPDVARAALSEHMEAIREG